MNVTLTISATGLRLLSVKGRQVKKWASAPLAPRLVRDGLILEPKEVATAIQSLFKSAEIPRERVIVSLTGLPFTYRILSLPRMKPVLLDEAIQRGIKREISLPLEELYLTWQAIRGEHDELDFFVLGVPKNLIDAVVQTLALAGVAPHMMDLKAMALARAANLGNAIVVALEPDCFDIVLVANGLPAIMHTISPRGEGATLADNIRRLADELSKTIKFHDSSYPDNTISPTTPLLLTGELSAEAMAGILIQAEVPYPVAPLVPPLKFPPDLSPARYAVNMGLALKKIPPKAFSRGETARYHDINLNILAGKYRKPRARPLPVVYLIVVLFLIIATGLLFPMYQVKTRASAETVGRQTELNQLSRELNQAKIAQDEAGQVEGTIKEIADAAAALRQERQDILGTIGDFTDNLESVTGALPSGAYFTSLEIGTDQIEVKGETDSPFTVISYATALEAQGGFSEIRIAEIEEAVAGTGPIAFEIAVSK